MRDTYPFVGKSVLSGSKNSPVIGFGSSNRFKKKAETGPGPSDYDADNDSIGARCRTALRESGSIRKSLSTFQTFIGRNVTPEMNEKAVVFNAVSEDRSLPLKINPHSMC
jgi:hypothetical protein